jgi:hypothetical protein
MRAYMLRVGLSGVRHEVGAQRRGAAAPEAARSR